MSKRLIKKAVHTLGLDPWFYPRARLAGKYLAGLGVEIGAQAAPLRLPRKARAKYVDNVSREESIRKFPELDPAKIVAVDYLADGFTLEGVPSGAFDFLIANHVLEHSPDPIGTLVNWHRVVKPGGILFIAVPLIHDCFDRGREITAFEHMLGDYEAARAGRRAELAERNKPHYREWLTISEPAVLGRPPAPPAELEGRIARMAEATEEIHFHTFTRESTEDLFLRVAERGILPGLRVLESIAAKEEVIVIARK